MSGGRRVRSPASGSVDRVLVFVGALVLGVGALEIAIQLHGTAGPKWILVEFVVAGWSYVLAGLVAWHRRPNNGLGAIMVAGGLAWLAANLQSIEIPAVSAVGSIVATVPLAVVVHIVHAFPSGRLTSRASRRTVLATYFISVVLQIPLYVFTKVPPPYDALFVADRPDLASAGANLQRALGGVLVLITAVILYGRLRSASPQQRRVLAPLYAYGVLAVVLVPVLPNFIQPLLDLDPELTGGLQVLELAGIPIAFAFGVLRGGFARTGELAELGVALGAHESARPRIADALASTLGDDSLALAFRVAGRDGYVDAEGNAVDTPGTEDDRRVVSVRIGERAVGAIVYDGRLIADPAFVEEAGRVAAIAIDRERLTAELIASQDALRRSRERIVEAGDRERRRLAANLHDGLQVRLVVLGIEAQQLAMTAPQSRAAATALRVGIDEAAEELRTLVHSVLPAALVERGLAAATEDLVDRMPVPTRLEQFGGTDGLPRVVESTAYFVIAEGLANALKHSAARSLLVRLERTSERLVVEVRDDGVGGAESRNGLRGLADRVDVLGGTLTVVSPPGIGTTLTAELPCVW